MSENLFIKQKKLETPQEIKKQKERVNLVLDNLVGEVKMLKYSGKDMRQYVINELTERLGRMGE